MSFRNLIKKFKIVLVLVLALASGRVLADAPGEFTYRLAQTDADDTYDPFADYSEFEQTSDEEADINFFRNGRFFTLGFIGGYRTFTQTLGRLYQDAPAFGLFLSYFFDLRFALQVHFLTGDHTISFSTPSGLNERGNASVTAIGLNLKYYINTQNVTKGLANLNPYVIGGFSQVYRTATINTEQAFAKDGALGFDFGGGIEVPIMRNKMYLGLQAAYQLVTFKDEQTEVVVNQTEHTGIYPNGDILTLLAILGVNF